jgi:hypothetical protein
LSNLVFPALAGLGVKVDAEAVDAVEIEAAASGKETRQSSSTYPRWRYRLDLNVLRAATAFREVQQFVTHVIRHGIRLDTFLFTHPEDSSVTDHGFAVGDGVNTGWQVQRTLGGDLTDAAGYRWQTQTKPYLNEAKNSSFETDTNVDGVADSWGLYNNESGTVPMYAAIVPGRNGGKAQRVSWGTNAGNTKGITSASFGCPAWITGQWYTVAFFARASGTNIGKFVSLAWNNFPSTTIAISVPALSATWQLYVIQVFYNVGAAVTSEMYLTINNNATGVGSVATGTFGDLDFDDVLVVKGQYDATTLPQPFATPAAATGTDTPAYWPGLGDGYEPIFEINAAQADPVFFEDGTWRSKRQLYPYARANLVPFSEQFSNAAWTKTNAAITADSTTAPDGTNTADTFSEGAAVTVLHHTEQTIVAEVTGELRCYSVFVKANSLPNITLLTNAANTFLNFNLSTGVIFSVGSEIVASGVITDPRWPGWFRIWSVHRATSLGSTFRVLAQADGTYSGAAYTGTNRTFFLWGAMCERVSNLSGPTPYIQTPSSVAVTVTDYTLSSTAFFTPATLPATGTIYSWTGSFYRRVRFDMGGVPLSKIVAAAWEAKAVQLITVKP